jgi:hypothetical protein
VSDGRIVVNGKFRRVWKEPVTVLLKAKHRHVTGENWKKYEDLAFITRQIIEIWASR